MINREGEKNLPFNIYRIIDANLNRLKEGIRVCEDIYRYLYNNREKASKLKTLRHKAKVKEYKQLLSSRNIKDDVLKSTTKSEKERKDIEAILIANFKRAEESSRVLEEIYKLIDINQAEIFKNIRYELYDIEIDLEK